MFLFSVSLFWRRKPKFAIKEKGNVEIFYANFRLILTFVGSLYLVGFVFSSFMSKPCLVRLTASCGARLE